VVVQVDMHQLVAQVVLVVVVVIKITVALETLQLPHHRKETMVETVAHLEVNTQLEVVAGHHKQVLMLLVLRVVLVVLEPHHLSLV